MIPTALSTFTRTNMNKSNLKFLKKLVEDGHTTEEVAVNILVSSFLGVEAKARGDNKVATCVKQRFESKTRDLTIGKWLATLKAAQLGVGSELKAQTIRNKTAIFNHIDRLGGHLELSRLRPMQIAADLKAVSTDSSYAAQRILAELRQLYTEAMANELVQTNPATNVRTIRVRVKRKRLGFDTYKAMLDVSDSKRPWVKCMLLLAIVTGQRRADLAKMKFSDIKDGYLHIEQQKEAGKGYGARVAIPLSLELEALGVTLGGVIKMCRRYGTRGEFLLRKDNGEALELSSLSIQFSALIQEVTAPGTYAKSERPSLHEIRSLSARLYKEQGIDTRTLLGHKNADMTALYEDDRGLSAKEFKKVGAKRKSIEELEVNTPVVRKKEDDWDAGF